MQIFSTLNGNNVTKFSLLIGVLFAFSFASMANAQTAIPQDLVPADYEPDLQRHIVDGRWSARNLGEDRNRILYIFHSFTCPFSAAFVANEADRLERNGVELRWFAWPSPGTPIDTLAYLPYTRDMNLFMQVMSGERINAPNATSSVDIVDAYNSNRNSVLFVTNLTRQVLSDRGGTPTFVFQNDEGRWELAAGYSPNGFERIRTDLVD